MTRNQNMSERWQQVLAFYKDKKVLVTGHTGFKGSWMCRVLCMAGAQVVGYALAPAEGENLYNLSMVDEKIHSYIGDIRSLPTLSEVFKKEQPEIVIHMAAQPIVRESYKFPVETYETNVMGTVNVLECIRNTESVRSVINVTTDKVYYNELGRTEAFVEDEPLMGLDPYSNSKSCSELVTYSYVHAFFEANPDRTLAVSTMRAGNVIGGGDFATDRIIPDCFRAARAGEKILLRHPFATRPFQHVLEPVMMYLLCAKEQYEDPYTYPGSYNIGPELVDCISVAELADLFCKYWQDGAEWLNICDHGPKEAPFLKLDCTKLKQTFDWNCRYNIAQAVSLSVDWYKKYANGEDMANCMDEQIKDFIFGGQE